MTRPIDLYYWPKLNSRKVSIALEEMGMPYVTKLIELTKGERFEPKLETISLNRRMPAIVDPDVPDGALVSIFESGAIPQYLARNSG